MRSNPIPRLTTAALLVGCFALVALFLTAPLRAQEPSPIALPPDVQAKLQLALDAKANVEKTKAATVARKAELDAATAAHATAQAAEAAAPATAAQAKADAQAALLAWFLSQLPDDPSPVAPMVMKTVPVQSKASSKAALLAQKAVIQEQIKTSSGSLKEKLQKILAAIEAALKLIDGFTADPPFIAPSLSGAVARLNAERFDPDRSQRILRAAYEEAFASR